MSRPESAETTVMMASLKDYRVAVGVDPPNGLAVIPVDGSPVATYVASSLVQLDSILRKFMHDLTVVVCGYEFAVLARSDKGFSHAKTSARCNQALGIIEAACGAFLVPMIGISAKKVKSAAVGDESASKAAVRHAMEALYHIDKIETDHEGDALAIATEALERFKRGKGQIPT